MAELSRRVFIGQTGAAAVAATAFAGEGSKQDPAFEQMKMLAGRPLKISRDGKTWTTCRLSTLEFVGDSPFLGARRPFSALLVAPGDSELEQDIYVIHDGVSEQFRQLLVPVDRTDEGLILELNFN